MRVFYQELGSSVAHAIEGHRLATLQPEIPWAVLYPSSFPRPTLGLCPYISLTPMAEPILLQDFAPLPQATPGSPI